MIRSIILSRRFAIPILLSALFVTYPAWSGPGNKPSLEKPADNAVMGKGDNKVGDRDGEKTDKKDGGSVKKNAVKKAGTAAAAGVATKKVTSTIKK